MFEKHFVTLLCYLDWHPTLLFGPTLLGTFANVPPYSVVRAYSVSDFEKCATLFRYISLRCYLELQSTISGTVFFTKSLVQMVFSLVLISVSLICPRQSSVWNFIGCLIFMFMQWSVLFGRSSGLWKEVPQSSREMQTLPNLDVNLFHQTNLLHQTKPINLLCWYGALREKGFQLRVKKW